MNALNEYLRFRNFLFEGVCTKQDTSLRAAIVKVLLECINKESEIDSVLKSSESMTTSQLARLGLFELTEIEDVEKNKKMILSKLRLEHRRLCKLNRGRAQTIGSNRKLYPHIKRWFDVVTSRMVLNLETPSPTNREVSVWSQERNLRVLRVVVAREHPLYADFFDFLDRKVPLHGVYSRMDKSLDRSVLDTPEKLIPVYVECSSVLNTHSYQLEQQKQIRRTSRKTGSVETSTFEYADQEGSM